MNEKSRNLPKMLYDLENGLELEKEYDLDFVGKLIQ